MHQVAATDTIDYVATDSEAANDNQASSAPANDNPASVAATSTSATSSVQ
jgi:hypothetical protein